MRYPHPLRVDVVICDGASAGSRGTQTPDTKHRTPSGGVSEVRSYTIKNIPAGGIPAGGTPAGGTGHRTPKRSREKQDTNERCDDK